MRSLWIHKAISAIIRLVRRRYRGSPLEARANGILVTLFASFHFIDRFPTTVAAAAQHTVGATKGRISKKTPRVAASRYSAMAKWRVNRSLLPILLAPIYSPTTANICAYRPFLLFFCLKSCIRALGGKKNDSWTALSHSNLLEIVGNATQHEKRRGKGFRSIKKRFGFKRY